MLYYNGKSYTMSWENGRQLSSTTTGGTATTYEYDTDGIRRSKTVNGTTTTFVTQNGKVVRQTDGWKTLDFIYDSQQRPYAVKYKRDPFSDAQTYYYQLNLQGDVVGIVDSEGYLVGRYVYDAWGYLIANGEELEVIGVDEIEDINPLRYRGYYYDSETGFYYLQSRYYDPNTGRFINADAAEYSQIAAYDINGTNLFAYCKNNPISNADDGGELWNVVIGAVVGGIVSGVVAGITSYKQTGQVDWGSVAISAAVGAANGAVAATGLGVFAQAGISAGVNAAGNYISQRIQSKQVSIKKVAISAATGFVTSIVGTSIGKALTRNLESVGKSMIARGQGKFVSGCIRKAAGKSSSKLISTGMKLYYSGRQIVNTARGITSVVGTVYTARLNAMGGYLAS